MRANRHSVRLFTLVVAGLVLFSIADQGRFASAQILPINSFSVAEGLAHNNVNQIFQDAKGYLWVATGEGLSRFDGYTFRNYDVGDGLSRPYINDVTADRHGHLWVAINEGGVARLLDSHSERDGNPAGKFRSFQISDTLRSKNVGKIVFDSTNRMWCATEAGVFRAQSTDVRDGEFDHVESPGDDDGTMSRAAFVDSRERLWFGFRDKVMKVENGSASFFDLVPGGRAFVNTIIEAPDGRIMAATNGAVYEFVETDNSWRPAPLGLADGLDIETIHYSTDDGSLWIGTSAGALNIRNDVTTRYSTDNGLTSNVVSVIFSDRDQGLWLGTYGGGLNKRANRAVVRFDDRRLAKPHRFIEGDGGNIFVHAGCQAEPLSLVRIANDKTDEAVSIDGLGDGCRRRRFLRLLDGTWLRAAKDSISIANAVDAVGGRTIALPAQQSSDKLLDLYQDKSGRLWVSAADRNLYVADLSQPEPRFEVAAKDVGASLILQDSHQTTWLLHNVFLGRLRGDVLDEVTGPESGLDVKLAPRSLFEDSRGRLWIGTRHSGVLYTDDPASDNLEFKRITTSDGLPSDAIWAITEDRNGTIYFGTNRGVVAYQDGSLRRFTSVDGMSESIVTSLFRDTAGRIWVGSEGGVSRIDPSGVDTASRPPAIFITGITVEGEDLPLDETGVTEITTADLGPDQNSLAIKFVGLNLKGERSLTYRYTLSHEEGAWSPPSTQREVNLVNLGPGSYRFVVKAIDQLGVESVTPAVIQFQILAPFWQRWWFIALSLIAISGALYALYRYRVSRVLEIERVRTRIATDLHDDIGSNLTRIALMSEVLNQQGVNGGSEKMLPSIANIARESVASMNDIVWAISPDHDRVLDLTRRMRQHAEEVFTIRDIDVKFVSDSSDSELTLPIGVRRDVLLIFKEAVNNAARHAGCTAVEIDFECTGSRLVLRIADNGKGFEKTVDRDGHGLTSMTRRAGSLGGRFEIATETGTGTTVRFEMPL